MIIQESYLAFVLKQGKSPKTAKRYVDAIEALSKVFYDNKPEWAKVADVWSMTDYEAIKTLHDNVLKEQKKLKNGCGIFKDYVGRGDSHFKNGNCSAALKLFAKYWNTGRPFRLISMYVGNFGCFQNQIFQFCSDYKTTKDNDLNGKLHLKVECSQILPNDFFALNEENEGNGCVKSVSAVIGKNGSGKTTLARLLCNLAASDNRKPSWRVVLIYELDGEITAYSTCDDAVITAGGHQIKCGCDVSSLLQYRLFYYSPYFTTEQFEMYTVGYHSDNQTSDEGDSIKDISTTGLMLHPEGNSELLLHDGVQQASIFDMDEKDRLFEFLSSYYSKGKGKGLNKFIIPKPTAISIGIHVEGFRAAISDLKNKVESSRRDESGLQKEIYSTTKSSPDELRDRVGEFLRDLIEPFENFKNQSVKYDFIVNVFMSYAARYFQECGMHNVSVHEELLHKGYLPSLKRFICSGRWTNIESIKSFIKENIALCNGGHYDSRGRSHISATLELIELLQELCLDSEKQQGHKLPIVRLDSLQMVLMCRLGDDEVLEKVRSLVMLHGKAREISSFMKFDVFPHMSSGEMSFLMLFARLYHFVGKVPKGKNVVVFLDEAETTLHPEWQQRLVAYCIRFFEVFLPGSSYQLIFSSHSPMLLSDIPVDNAVFLDHNFKNEKNRTDKYSAVVSTVNKELGYTNSFGANIIDLYGNSFFMHEGTIGVFAKHKIDEYIKDHATKYKDVDFVGMVGDPLIRTIVEDSTRS